MKKAVILLAAWQCIFLLSCNSNDKNISITYKDKDDTYSMNARFSKSKTWQAERYMDQKIGRKNNFSFINTRTDAILTLEDGSKFYMKKSPGHIVIKIDKTENSKQAFYNLRSMCEGMKSVLHR